MMNLRRLPVGGLVVLMFLACGSESQDKPQSCYTNDDCTGGMFCIEFECAFPPSCLTDGDCPQGLKCLSDGTCAANIECETESDCLNIETCSDGGCQCKLNECWGTQCLVSGETKACFNGCHQGNQMCEKGYWSLCDAVSYQPDEDCSTPWDDNCNGQANEECPCESGETLECTGPCGAGEKKCVQGAWGDCVSPLDCCQPGATQMEECGFCGSRARNCLETAEWGPWGTCEGEGLCQAGAEESSKCGTLCGEQVRGCTDECTWSDWSQCTSPPDAMCEPGQTEEKSCLNCGLQVKVCDDECHWEPWGECVPGLGCKVGDTEEKPCGDCGVVFRSCLEDCIWGEWSDCAGEGVCSPGELKTTECELCGKKEAVCSENCKWGDWGQCEYGGVCDSGDEDSQPCGPSTDQGECKKGTQKSDCNENCQWEPWGACEGAVYPQPEMCGDGIDQNCNGSADDQLLDSYEKNNTCGSCFWLAGTDPEVTLQPTFDSPQGGSDPYDYFCFQANDDWDWPFTSEHIVVELTNQPYTIDGDISLFKGEADCLSGKFVASDLVIGNGNEKIDWNETGENDSGTYYVRVENYSQKGNCTQPYTLKVKGLK